MSFIRMKIQFLVYVLTILVALCMPLITYAELNNENDNMGALINSINIADQSKKANQKPIVKKKTNKKNVIANSKVLDPKTKIKLEITQLNKKITKYQQQLQKLSQQQSNLKQQILKKQQQIQQFDETKQQISLDLTKIEKQLAETKHQLELDTISTKPAKMLTKNEIKEQNFAKNTELTNNLPETKNKQDEIKTQQNEPQEKNIDLLLAQAQKYYQANNYTTAFKFFYQAAKLGNATAQHYVGIAYLLGNGVNINYSNAKFWLEQASLQKDYAAINDLAIIYMEGYGVPKNTDRALALLKIACDAGNTTACKNYKYPVSIYKK